VQLVAVDARLQPEHIRPVTDRTRSTLTGCCVGRGSSRARFSWPSRSRSAPAATMGR
jgi:hypothetical protein